MISDSLETCWGYG